MVAELKAHGVDCPERWIRRGAHRIESGYEQAQWLTRNAPGFTAIACGSDLIAVGALSALKEAGIGVPGDVSLIGYDDIYLTKLVEPNITTVRLPASAMGQSAMRMLIQHMLGQHPTEVRVSFQPELIERKSVRDQNE